MNKELYKEIKKFNRAEMASFIDKMYTKGFMAGTDAKTVVDCNIDLVKTLQGIKGIGEKTIYKIMEAVLEGQRNGN